MTRLAFSLIVLSLVFADLSALQQKQPPRPNRDGRKTRLFAPQDLGLLEPPDREAWQKPDQVMDALHVADGTTVADLGAGGGWFTIRLARRVGPNGRVYAVDVQRLMKEAIERRVQREGLGNVETDSGRRKRSGTSTELGRGRTDRRCVSRDGRSRRAAAERRKRAEAARAASASSITAKAKAAPAPTPRIAYPQARSSRKRTPRASRWSNNTSSFPISTSSSLPSRLVLTIAGSDSIAGAGIQADVKTFAAMGVYGVTAVTAITAQNTTGVIEVLPCSAEIVRSQIEAVARDVSIAAVKTGMLATSEIVNAAADAVEYLGRVPLVVDPVMSAGGQGRTLLAADAVSILKTRLFPLATVVTPNATEAAALTGIAVDSLESARKAAERIHRFGAAAVVVKGGHIAGADAVDVLFYDGGFMEFSAPRADRRRSARYRLRLCLGHCRPSCAGRRHSGGSAARQAVTSRARSSIPSRLAEGARILNHFWELSL